MDWVYGLSLWIESMDWDFGLSQLGDESVQTNNEWSSEDKKYDLERFYDFWISKNLNNQEGERRRVKYGWNVGTIYGCNGFHSLLIINPEKMENWKFVNLFFDIW